MGHPRCGPIQLGRWTAGGGCSHMGIGDSGESRFLPFASLRVGMTNFFLAGGPSAFGGAALNLRSVATALLRNFYSVCWGLGGSWRDAIRRRM